MLYKTKVRHVRNPLQLHLNHNFIRLSQQMKSAVRQKYLMFYLTRPGKHTNQCYEDWKTLELISLSCGLIFSLQYLPKPAKNLVKGSSPVSK